MNWIKTSEKLPPYGKNVLVTLVKKESKMGSWVKSGTSFVTVGERTHTNARGEHWNVFHNNDLIEITHWAELPKPAQI